MDICGFRERPVDPTELAKPLPQIARQIMFRFDTIGGEDNQPPDTLTKTAGFSSFAQLNGTGTEPQLDLSGSGTSPSGPGGVDWNIPPTGDD
jgi:hypothetical protein